MKTKTIFLSALFAGIAISLMSYNYKGETSQYSITVESESEAKKLFEAKCKICHVTTKPADMSKLVAPPIMGVMMHVKKGVKGKNEAEKRENAIAFMVDYVRNPSAEKSMLEPMALERFGVMPSQKLAVTKKEVTLIANYLYDNFPPAGMNHGNMHKGNKKGCGSGCGDDCKH